MGTVAESTGGEDGRRLTIVAPIVSQGLEVGASIAVNGTCLTALEASGDSFVLHMVPETLSRTNLGEVDAGGVVNLERAMPASGRFDGHIVQGHVDGVGVVTAVEPEGDGRRITIELPGELGSYVVEKGSITVDGVSLTVAGVTGAEVTIALIPHTLEVTTLGRRRTGERVNIEVDILAKYVERLVAR
jgi:riboflavin synthase